jgi:hypothetical protein
VKHVGDESKAPCARPHTDESVLCGYATRAFVLYSRQLYIENETLLSAAFPVLGNAFTHLRYRLLLQVGGRSLFSLQVPGMYDLRSLVLFVDSCNVNVNVNVGVNLLRRKDGVGLRSFISSEEN